MKKNKRFEGRKKALYRIKDDEKARELGLTPNKNRRYRLDAEQEAKWLNRGGDIKRLFFDIETSPMIAYTWRTGSKIYLDSANVIKDWGIICISWKWEGEDKVHNAVWDDGDDQNILEKFLPVLHEADLIIAHNGDKFDLKKLRTRALYHGLYMRPKLRTQDTLKDARYYFAFDSNRLDALAKWLGVGAKLQHEGFDMWVKVMQGDKDALKRMVDYCDQDVVVLENVYQALRSYVQPRTHAGVHMKNPKHSCPNCGGVDVEFLEIDVTPAGTIKNVMGCNTCNHEYPINQSSFKNFILNRI